MEREEDYHDSMIRKIEYTIDKVQYYQGIVNGYCDGESNDLIEEDEAERLADSWERDLVTISEASNLTMNTIWGMSILTHESKRAMLVMAEANKSSGKMSISVV